MKLRPLALAPLVLVLLMGCGGGNEEPSTTALLQQLSQQMSERAERGAFSGTILVAQDGEVVFRESYGFANRETAEQIEPSTRFTVASVGKSFTAVAIAQLVSAGKLSFSDPVREHLPHLPGELTEGITIDQLLTHTSGLGDFFGPRYDEVKDSLYDLSDYLPLISPERTSRPGDRFGYSNAGYILLGLIVEQVSGQPFFEYLEQHIWAPLGMRQTSAEGPGATGYTFWERGRKTKELRPTTGAFANTASSAGGVYTTAEDLFRFAEALRTNRLLAPELTAELTKGRVATTWGSRWGYGIEEITDLGFVLYGHAGDAEGVASRYAVLPEAGITLVILSNMDDPDGRLSPSRCEEPLVRCLLEGANRRPVMRLLQGLHRAATS